MDNSFLKEQAERCRGSTVTRGALPQDSYQSAQRAASGRAAADPVVRLFPLAGPQSDGRPGEQRYGRASFEAAHAAFEAAWLQNGRTMDCQGPAGRL
jgi:hypothetical protein